MANPWLAVWRANTKEEQECSAGHLDLEQVVDINSTHTIHSETRGIWHMGGGIAVGGVSGLG